MKRVAPAVSLAVAFAAGLLVQLLYQRWNPATPQEEEIAATRALPREAKSYPVTYRPLESSPPQLQAELPTLPARAVDQIRAHAGAPARVRGRIFRVGHSSKSNTYFLNFGPSREALTAVIFASAAELFEKNKLFPKSLEGREVEVQGEVKDHPQYGLEIILETPAQIKIID